MATEIDARRFEHLAHQGDVKVVYVHQLAAETIQAMRSRVQNIGAVFGQNGEEYRKAAESLMLCLSSIYTGGWAREAYVTKDGDLSLLVQEGNAFVYGIVWFRDKQYDAPPPEHLKALVNDAQPGEWSMHS